MNQKLHNHSMRTLTVLCAAALAALAVACQKDDNTVDLTAVVADRPDSGAKVYIDGLYGCWQQGDAVKIHNGSSADNYSLAVTGTDGLTATISGVAQGDSYTAGYPAANTTVSGPGALAIELPAVQTYESAAISGDAGDAAQRIVSPMAAYSTGDILKFYNVGALLKVVVSNTLSEALTLYAVEVESDNAPLSGIAAVTATAKGASISTVSGTGKSVTLSLSGAGVTLDASTGSATLYIPVLPIAENAKSNLTVHVKATGTSGKYTFHGESAAAEGVWIAQNQIGTVPVTLEAGGKTCVDAYFWGKGTEECPFIIETEDDLYNLRTLTNNATSRYCGNSVYYLQAADLDISSQTNWGSSSNYAVGNSTNSFKANYDGDGHSVKLGVTTSTTDCPIGIFGVIGEGSAISNLTSTGSISATTKSAAGGVVGSVTGAATINSCNNNATIKNTLSGMYYIGTGGICGHIDAPSCNVSIVNCSNNGTVTVNQLRAGGILGCHDDGILTISGCVNNSAISQTSSQSNMASGGIVGHMYSSSGSATVSGCTNNGTVTGYINVGGIIGRTEKVTVVSGCSNTNAISSYTSGSSYHYNIGGVVGSANNTLTLQGTISQTGNVTGWYYVGGVVGYMNSTLTVDENAEIEVNATVKYCGSVTCTTYSTTTCATACATGGFAGYCNYLQINGNVTVSGAVTHNGTAYRCVGGLVGVIGGQSKTDCYLNAGSKAKITNNASVEGAYYVGGFVGWAQKMTLTNGSNWHKNIGDVTGTLYTGGVVGHVQNASSTFNRCVNEGAVQGSYHVGGLVGKANLATSFAYCLNYGAITATSYASQSGVAGIVGSAGSGALTFSKCKNEGNINGINGSTTLYVAGISGYTNVNVTMSDCGNTGTITGRGYGVSGLVAMCRTTSTIINSYNQGNIVYSNTTNTGGGITSAYNTKPTITNCYFSGVPSNTGSLSNYANMSGSYNNSSSYKATCSNCYSIDQTTKGSNNAAANYTISLNNDAEYITSNSGAYLVTALNNWQSSNTSYNSWVASDYTELPHLSWEDNLNL